MNTLNAFCSGILFATGHLLAAAGEPSPVHINPAQLYYQAFLAAPDPMSPEDMDYAYSKEGRSQPLPERFGKLLTSYDAQFRLVRRAAQSTEPCDWGLDMSEGPATRLPHLARAKAVAQAAKLRVRWDLEQGRQEEACEDLIATLVLARNLPRDGLLISTLVQIAVEAILCNTVAENFGLFSPESLQRVVDGFEAAPPRVTVAACLPSEKGIFHDWAISQIQRLQKQHAGDDARVMAGMGSLFGIGTEQGDTNLWERLKAASGGTSDGVIRLFREREKYEAKLAAVTALPYAEYQATVKEIAAEFASAPNPLVAEIFPAFGKARARELRVLTSLAMVRAAAEYKLHGEPGLLKVADPCGAGPFAFRRFELEGVDRGFELKSVYDLDGNKGLLIFVEKPGTPFRVDGPRAGTALSSESPVDQFRRRYGIETNK